MDNRIKEIIQEATGFTMRVYETNGVRTYGEREEFFDKEKFAELLAKEFEAKHFSAGYIQGRSDAIIETVLECANYLDAFNRENMVEEGIGGTELKQHFGVE